MRTIIVINQKGGCGKTTTSINLACCFAHRGCRTLLVDLDPQSHCAAGLGIPEDRLDLDISDAMRAPVDQVLNRDRLLWRAGRNLDLLPSRMKLAGLEAAHGGLADQPEKELRLRSVLDRLTRVEGTGEDGTAVERRYDVCIIDCPPSIGLLSYNAIAAGREVLIPVETSFFSLRGAGKQVQTARSIARRLGMRIQPRLLATMHNQEQPLARDLLDDLRDRFGAGMIPVVIHYDHALKEAASFGMGIEEYAPDSVGAEDYRSLCEWLIEHANVDRPEPGDKAGSMGDAPRVRPIVLAGPREKPDGTVVSRSEEMAMRAKAMHTRAPVSSESALVPASVGGGAVVAERTGHLKRSMMPHRPVVVELVDDRVVEPTSSPALEKVRHLFGVRAVTGGVLFVLPLSIAQRVEVVGSFNKWNPTRTAMKRNEELGIFELHLKLAGGTYEYKIVLDGQWGLDPYNKTLVENGVGSMNNAVRVEAQ
ncbi:MAG: AAA family ATPase [Phycisphaerales bacterium]|nr:AAA family ATPase [Phycisphaerales bacterium]